LASNQNVSKYVDSICSEPYLKTRFES